MFSIFQFFPILTQLFTTLLFMTYFFIAIVIMNRGLSSVSLLAEGGNVLAFPDPEIYFPLLEFTKLNFT